jgi:hypothetical protein
VTLSGYCSAPVDCSACGERFTGRWEFGAWLETHPYRETEQACPSCGHLCRAAWPGWGFEPETRVLERGSETPGFKFS